MTAQVRGTQRAWSGERDELGHRDYKLVSLVEADTTDGPANVMQAIGLPLVGSYWQFDNDVDLWAWCRPNASVKRHEVKEGHPGHWWTVEQTFSTRPLNRCSDTAIEDPLLEPMKVSGGSIRYTEEATFDRFNNPIVNSAWEQIRGASVEFDKNRSRVRIEQNVADLEYELCSAMENCVNLYWLWGLPPRCIKLSAFDWDTKYHGQCEKYYTRIFDFDASVRKIEGEFAATSYVLVNAGSGYVVGDTVTLVGGSSSTAVQLQVTAIGFTGNITGIDIITAGQYTVVPANPVSTSTSGLGMLASFNIAWGDAMVSAFDRDVLDEGTKALHGYNNGREWVITDVAPGVRPDEVNPNHFVRYKDSNGENARVILDGYGQPIDITPGSGSGQGASEPGKIHVEKYDGADFLLLGIPLVF